MFFIGGLQYEVSVTPFVLAKMCELTSLGYRNCVTARGRKSKMEGFIWQLHQRWVKSNCGSENVVHVLAMIYQLSHSVSFISFLASLSPPIQLPLPLTLEPASFRFGTVHEEHEKANNNETGFLLSMVLADGALLSIKSVGDLLNKE